MIIAASAPPNHIAIPRKWKEKIYRFELVAAESDATEESEEQTTLREEIDGIAQRINRCVAELEPVGCVLKGFDDGLIDFYSKMDGGEVFLCWKLGEDTIEHWHELDVGFPRRALDGAPRGYKIELLSMLVQRLEGDGPRARAALPCAKDS